MPAATANGLLSASGDGAGTGRKEDSKARAAEAIAAAKASASGGGAQDRADDSDETRGEDLASLRADLGRGIWAVNPIRCSAGHLLVGGELDDNPVSCAARQSTITLGHHMLLCHRTWAAATIYAQIVRSLGISQAFLGEFGTELLNLQVVEFVVMEAV